MRRTFSKFLVTAALPYANGKIHLGHLAGAYLPADIYVRYQRSLKRDVLFICGSDEHGVPITITAEQEHITPQAVVDRYHALNKSAFEQFGMSFDRYSRTSLPLHHETALEFFLRLHDAGILKEKRDRQLYDEKAGMFLPDRYVVGTCPVCGNTDARGDQCERCGTFLNPTELLNPRSTITGETPAVRETTHWYFPLGQYQQRLEEYIGAANERDGWKENVMQYCRSWFKEGLQDRAVTRDLQWGVKVPLKGFENKVLYVWFDAVLGYISGTKEWAAAQKGRSWKDYWCDPSTKYVAFIGKDNVVFHCIVFPAMLMAWNSTAQAGQDRFVLPENVPANEFLNFEGQKFSKSRGWGIDVDEFLSEFPPDTLRYTLATNLPEARDADFTWRDFQARTNNELADIFGNFVNRTLTFAHRTFQAKVPPRGNLSPLDKELLNLTKTGAIHAGELIDHYRFRDATLEIMNIARSANKYFNDNAPWKTSSDNPERCATTIHICLQTIRSLAILFEPIIPFTCARIWSILNLPGTPSEGGWKSAGELALGEGSPLGRPEILFAKIENDVIRKYAEQLPAASPSLPGPDVIAQAAASAVPAPPPAPGARPAPVAPAPAPGPQAAAFRPVISADTFRQADLRVGKVLSAERVPKSEKLLRLQVSLGSAERQIIAGIAQHYSPESLVGKKIIVVANLAPAKLMGHESQGMLLAASDASGALSILTVDADIDEGSAVK